VSIAALNLLRLAQVGRRVGIQPYERIYLRLALPSSAAALAALGAHGALSGQAWWASLAATAACGLVAYGVLLPLALPAGERAALGALAKRVTSGGSRRERWYRRPSQ
jgi:hypothetical protein